jgi:membrane complex biogenesis BtpA family protein
MPPDHLGLGIARPIIGVVHLRPLPGSPRFSDDTSRIVEQAVDDVSALVEGGAEAIMIENFGDTPFFPKSVPRETIAWMTRIGTIIRARTSLPLGVCVLRNDARAGLAIAHAIDGQFIRVCILGLPRVTDQGLIEGEAYELLRDRARLRADIKIWADVDIKHSYPLAPNYSLERDAADLVARSHADALIVTGSATGAPIEDSHLAVLYGKVGAPVLVGSGVTDTSIGGLVNISDGFIVGTGLKEGSGPDARISVGKTRALRAARDGAMHRHAD